MKYIIITLISFSILCSSSIAQQANTKEIYTAPFKNNATGAYTLIHDDFGASWASGIENYVDTMAYNRHIPICFAVITKECDKSDWKKANELIAHHHQIINHTMSHKCGVQVDWCQAGNWDEHNFNVEFDSSTAWIKKNTGKHPAFFIFPFDLFSDTMITYLEASNYLGARAGRQNATNPADQLTPFRLNFQMHRPEEAIAQLDSFAIKTVREKSWGIRVLHGVGDDSWGSLNPVDYGNHLDYISKLSKDKQLWVATLSDVVTYQYMKAKYIPQAKQRDAKGRVTRIEFNNNPDIVLPLESLLTDKVITIVIKQKTKSYKEIIQGNIHLHADMLGDEMMINAIADKGEIMITY